MYIFFFLLLIFQILFRDYIKAKKYNLLFYLENLKIIRTIFMFLISDGI